MSWPELTRELDHWSEEGREATLWWRDDDAQTYHASLDRLLNLSRFWQVPVAISVVPDHASEELPAALSESSAQVLQHGFQHVNRAPPDAGKCELLADSATEDALASGRTRLAALFGSLSLPVLVPPWNRIDEALLPRLADLGYSGLSRYKARDSATVSGLQQVNTHVDIINWRSGRRFLGETRALTLLVEHLRGRRTFVVDGDEPTGLLTHHLEHDEDCWTFVDRLLGRTRDHPAVSWLSPGEIFSGGVRGAASDEPSPNPRRQGR